MFEKRSRSDRQDISRPKEVEAATLASSLIGSLKSSVQQSEGSAQEGMTALLPLLGLVNTHFVGRKQFTKWNGFSDFEALYEVDTKRRYPIFDRLIFDELGNRFFA